MTPLLLGPARGRLLLHGLLSLGFVAGGALMVWIEPGIVGRAVGASSVLFFGACFGVLMRQWLDDGPRIVVNDEGILDRTLRVGLIPWRDIVAVSLRRVNDQPFLSLHLRNAGAYVARLGPLQRRLVEVNRALGAELLNVNLVAVDVDPAAFAELVSKEIELRRREAAHYRDGD